MEKILSLPDFVIQAGLHCITLRMTISYVKKGLVVELFWRLSCLNISTTNQHPKVPVIPRVHPNFWA
jgi:hypothetical protein